MRYSVAFFGSANNAVCAEQYLDRQILHKNICSAFGSTRKENNILYYMNCDKNMNLVLLVQSDSKPVAEIPGFTMISAVDISGTIDQIKNGDSYKMRIMLSPSYRFDGKRRCRKNQQCASMHNDYGADPDAKTGYDVFFKQHAEKYGYHIRECRSRHKEDLAFIHKAEKKGGYGIIPASLFEMDIVVTDSDKFITGVEKGMSSGKCYGAGLAVIDGINDQMLPKTEF